MKRFFLLILYIIYLYGCTTNTVRGSIKNPDFQKENQPIRTVRVVLVAKNNENLERGKKAIRSVSELIESQVGIRFKVIKTLIRKQGFSSGRIDALNELVRTCTKEGLRRGEYFDIAVGISNYSFWDYLVKISLIPIFVWDGVIDDDLCRCYYVTKTLKRRVNAHEMMHSFMLDFEHDETGLMAGTTFKLFPGISLGRNNTLYLSPKARASVLRHKWRDFSRMPSGF